MKRIALDTASIRNVHQLSQALDDLMGYPGWYGDHMAEWVEMISFFDRPDCPVGASSKPEHYILELNDASSFVSHRAQIFRAFVSAVGAVNEHYRSRSGSPLISVVFID